MGTLGIPYAIKVGGLSSIIYIVIIAVVTCYTGGLIIEAQYDDGFDEDDKEGKEKSKPRVGYAAVGELDTLLVNDLHSSLTLTKKARKIIPYFFNWLSF